MSPKTNGQDVQVYVIQPIYKTGTKCITDSSGARIKNEFGYALKSEEKKFVKEAWLKVWMKKQSIPTYGEYVGSKGEVVKNRSTIYNTDTQNYYTVAHSIKELEDALQIERREKIGLV